MYVRMCMLCIADRLLAQGFSAELQLITSLMTHPKRQTLLFSATMTASLAEVESVASDDTLRFDIYITCIRIYRRDNQQYAKICMCIQYNNYLIVILLCTYMIRFDLTKEQKIPAKLVQQYLFLPAQVYYNYVFTCI